MIINREYYLNQLISQKDKDIVKIVTGIRRSGKSVLLFELFYNYLIKSGISDNHIIKLAFDSKKNRDLRDSNLLYEYISNKIIDDEKYYILLDEIQLVDNFEEVVNDLKRDFNSDIYITGSNSKMLSKDINTIFRGRGIEIRIYPLSFLEYYNYYKGDKMEAFNNYVMYGGLPYLLQEEDNANKVKYLNMICDTVVTKDIIDRYHIRNTEVFNALIDLLCSSIGSYVSPNKIANTLKSNGVYTIDNETISKYLDYLCDAFLFYKVNRYDIKGKEYLKTLNKYYITDIGIRNAKLNYRQLEMTHTIENIVYMELIERGFIVDIGKNINQEIDFVAKNFNDTYYIQVSFTIEDEKTRERELGAFKHLDDGYKKIVITMDNSPFTILENGYKKINMIDFLLDKDCLTKI